jgi:hypothetical protein
MQNLLGIGVRNQEITKDAREISRDINRRKIIQPGDEAVGVGILANSKALED